MSERTCWDFIAHAIRIQEEAKSEKVCIVWPVDSPQPYIRPIEQRNNPIIVVGKEEPSFANLRPGRRSQEMPIRVEDLMPKDALDVPNPMKEIENRKQSKYTRAGQQALKNKKKEKN